MSPYRRSFRGDAVSLQNEVAIGKLTVDFIGAKPTQAIWIYHVENRHKAVHMDLRSREIA